MDRAHKADAVGTMLSLEEFERLPEEDECRVELVRGRIVRELPGFRLALRILLPAESRGRPRGCVRRLNSSG